MQKIWAQVIALFMLWMGIGCGARMQQHQIAIMKTSADAQFQVEIDTFLQGYWAFRPTDAVAIGLHAWDGQLPPRSEVAISAEVSRLQAAHRHFSAFNPEALSKQRQLERDFLLLRIQSELFELQELRLPWRNPMSYLDALDLTAYIGRDYKPMEERARTVIVVAEGVGRYLAEATADLQVSGPKPWPWIDTALLQVNGTIEFIKKDVPQAFAALKGRPIYDDLAHALAQMAIMLTRFRDFLHSEKTQADENWALGEHRFLRMLAETQGIQQDLPTLMRMAQKDLQRNLQALEQTARAVDTRARVREVVAMVAQDKPALDQVLAEARHQAEATRQFLLDRDIASIPNGGFAEVRESPPFKRWNAAFLETAGVFESKSLPSFYYITPPDPTWPVHEQQAYVPARSELFFTTIHELWPGHFLHHLHVKRSPSTVLKSFWTYSTGEGWAHYVEEMMWEAGIGQGDGRLHIGQLKEALLRNVRFVVALGLHTQGMTLAEATKLFETQAFTDPATARQQAIRGTFDPMYVSYTLGKLMIQQLREDYQKKTGNRSLKAFHDAFLHYACAPIPLIRQQLLGD